MNTVRKILSRIPRLTRRHAAARPQCAPRTCAAAIESAAVGAGDAAVDRLLAAGCGWFDSSHELERGLVVREHASVDTLADQLPLTSWFELHLSGWRGALPA